MKRLLLLLLLGCVLSTAQAQKILVTPYVLGLVDDHKGRTWVKDNPEENTLIDKFHSTETILLHYLDSLIQEDNKKTYDKVFISSAKWEKPDCFYCQEFRRMQSVELTKLLHEAYTFKGSKEVDAKGFKILVGHLKPKFLKDDKERLSFLAGAYVRYGLRENDEYKIRLNTTASKYEAVVRELRNLKCQVLKEEVTTGEIKIQQVTFIPSPHLKYFLDKQERMRLDILKKKDKFYKEKKQEQGATDIFTAPEEKQL